MVQKSIYQLLNGLNKRTFSISLKLHINQSPIGKVKKVNKMAFLGKTYTLEKDENFKGFIESLGVSEERIQALLTFKSSQTIKKDGDDYVLTFVNPEGTKDLKFKSGVEFDEQVAAGITAKTTFTVDGNVVNQVQKFDNMTINFKREYSGDELVVIITSSSWDGTARRYYKA